MTFTSLSDLYFIATGIWAYNVFWNLFVDTSIILIPFALMVGGILKESTEKSKKTSDATYISKQVETQFAIMVISFSLFFLPVRDLPLSNMMQYTRSCETPDSPSTVEQHIEGSGTFIYGEQGDEVPISGTTLEMIGAAPLKIPMMLNIFITTGTALSIEAVKRMPCSISLTGVQNEVLKERIDDPDLYAEVRSFVSTCYNRAYNWSLTDDNFPWHADPNTVDKPWPGHRLFFHAKYYGNNLRGMWSDVALYGYQSSDTNLFREKWVRAKEAGEAWTDVKGYPTCYEWWRGVNTNRDSGFSLSSQNESLRSRLIEQMPNPDANGYTLRLIGNLVDTAVNGIGEEERNDLLLQIYYFNKVKLREIRNADVREYQQLSEGAGSTVTGWVGRLFGTVGTAASMPEAIGVASMVQLAAPIAKGRIIFAIILALPLVGIVSKYSLSLVLSLHFTILSILLWPVLWEMIMLVQQSYWETVFDDNIWGIFNLDEVNNKMLITVFTDSLFVILPVVLTTLLAMAGMKGGAEISGSMGNSAKSLGGKGAGGANKSVSNAKGKIKDAKKAKEAK